MNILITGGSSGLGKAMVEKFSSNPDNLVYFTYNTNITTACSIVKEKTNVFAKQCDFSSENSIADLLNSIGGWDLDVLINNAYSGNPQGNHFHKESPDSFTESFLLNIIPTIRITQKTIETFRKKKSGKIITILSSALLNQPPTGYSLYSANKAYMAQLAKSWSKEYIRYGITSNCISPNFMLTDLTKNTDDRIVEHMTEEHPLKKLLVPEEVAECAEFLVYASNQVNGVNIPLNAGTNIL